MRTRTNKHSTSTSSIVTANGTVVAAGTPNVRIVVKNLKAGESLYVKKGAGAAATSGNFTDILPPGNAVDDGFGGSIPFENYTGAVSIFAASTAPRALVVIDTE